jgi:hypothetical protein
MTYTENLNRVTNDKKPKIYCLSSVPMLKRKGDFTALKEVLAESGELPTNLLFLRNTLWIDSRINTV